VVLTAKIPDLLAEHHDGLSLDDLAKLTGLDKDKLGRVLRYLAAKHIFREGKEVVVFCVQHRSLTRPSSLHGHVRQQPPELSSSVRKSHFLSH
jgi:hypothetical protein